MARGVLVRSVFTHGRGRQRAAPAGSAHGPPPPAPTAKSYCVTRGDVSGWVGPAVENPNLIASEPKR